jgi:hypothetical protein
MMQNTSDNPAESCPQQNVFKYEPLGTREIRLLKVLPGAFGEDVVCNMLTVDRDSCPEYTAISYTWGNETPLYQMHTNGQQPSIRETCLHALRQVRHFLQEGSPFSIDTVCINQEEPVEKGYQVRFMDEIYQRAVQVLACIGRKGGEGTDAHVELLAKQSQNLERLWTLNEATNDCERYVKAMFQGSDRHLCHVVPLWLVTLNVDELYSLYDAAEIISSSPYWTRLWIVQEIFLSRNVRVLCDPAKIRMQFLAALDMVRQNINENDHVLKRIADDHGLNMKGKPEILRLHLGVRLFRLCSYRELSVGGNISAMDDVMDLECADPRDRIYGLIHLHSWPSCTGPPTPSYTKTRLEVISDYFRHRGLSYK